MDVALGEAGEAEAAATREHAAGCEACGEFLAELDPTVGLFREAAPAMWVDPPPELRVRTLAALAAERAGPSWLEALRSLLDGMPAAALAGALAAVLVAVVLSPAEEPFVPGPDKGIRLARVHGILSTRTRGDAAPIPLEDAAGRVVTERGYLVLPEGSAVELDWHGRGPVEVRGPAEVMIEGNGLELHRGFVRSRVRPGAAGFEVRTHVATARVVGTVFTVEAGPGGVEIEVEEGRVEVVPASPTGETVVLVEGGEWSYIETEPTPTPTPTPVATGVGAPSTVLPTTTPDDADPDEDEDPGHDPATSGGAEDAEAEVRTDPVVLPEEVAVPTRAPSPTSRATPIPETPDPTTAGTGGEVEEVEEEPLTPPETIEAGF